MDDGAGPPQPGDTTRRDASIALDERRRAINEHEAGTDPVRELIGYFLNRPWVDTEALMGGLVNREPRHIARLRETLEADLATVSHCLAALDALQPAEATTT